MQSEHQKKIELDDDILQCKAQLQKVMQSAGGVRAESTLGAQPHTGQAGQTVQSVHPAHPLQPENKDNANQEQKQDHDASDPKPSSQAVGARILPFETLHKGSPNNLASDAGEPDPPRPTQPAADIQAALEENIGRLNEKIQEIDKLQESNQQLKQSLDESARFAADKQQRIEDLEHQLAEKINELSALKFCVEEYAATLAEQAQQLRRADQQKEDVEKRLEEQTLEWAKTIDAMKAAQEAAARTLRERQRELESLRAELSSAESRIEQVDADNARLLRENAELTETIEDVRMQLGRQEEEWAMQDAVDDQQPEPYCEPCEEVISEDDVHLEQKLTADNIPPFDLAEQILSEQRKASSARRRQPQQSGKRTPNGAIEHVMEQYFSNAPSADGSSSSSRPQRIAPTHRFPIRQDEYLSDYQQALLSGIVQKDIQRFCGHEAASASIPRPFPN